MKLDFSDVKENETMKAGKTHLNIVGAKEGVSSNGISMLVVDFKDERGAFTRDNICLEGSGAFKCKQFISALGLKEDEFANMDAKDLIDLDLDAEIIIETYEGQDRAKIKKYYPVAVNN